MEVKTLEENFEHAQKVNIEMHKESRQPSGFHR